MECGTGSGRGPALMATLICFGFGYCAEHFVAEFGGKFERIVGTVRGADRAAIMNAYASKELRLLPFDGVRTTPALESAIAAADYVLISIPPDENGDPVLAVFGDTLAGGNLRSVVYLSTIGVYGDHRGGWVDEQTPPAPSSDRGRWRVARRAGSSSRDRFSIVFTSVTSRRRSKALWRAAPAAYSISPMMSPARQPIRSSLRRSSWAASRRRRFHLRQPRRQ